MNVAGKRVAPAEIESVLATDAVVAESAVVGIPDSTKGEAVWAFWVRRPSTADADGDEDDGLVSARLTALVAGQVGKPFAPARVVRVAQLPKTRSARSCAGRSARPCSAPIPAICPVPRTPGPSGISGPRSRSCADAVAAV
jgi:hypothetical protein